jgi:hypothetical protein
MIAFLLMTMLALSGSGSIARSAWAAQNTQSAPVSIDQALFLSTVPSYAVLGHNYTVRLLVNNTTNESVPIILRVNVPVGVIYTHPTILQLIVEPGRQVLTNFSLIAFDRYNGLINVTAMMWVWFYNETSRPVLAEQVSTVINGVLPSPLSTIALVSVVALLVATAAVVVIGIRRGKRGGADLQPL